MIVCLEIEESGCIDKPKLIESIRTRLADLVHHEEFANLERIVVRGELLSANPYISPR